MTDQPTRDDAHASESDVLRFRADPDSVDPPYQQLRGHVRAGIGAGRILPGERLPTVRALAAAADLAPNTIASAYRALEADQLVEGRGRAGTFVSLDALGDTAARTAAHAYVAQVVELGIDLAGAQVLVREAYRAAGARPDA